MSKGFNLEVCEANHGDIVGHLQILVTNQGAELSNPRALEERK